MSSSVVPVYAQGFFIMSRLGRVTQIVVFDYYDPEKYYLSLLRKGSLEEELSRIEENMQYFLDEERVYINGVRVYPKVISTTLGFRGDVTRPYITFIIEFGGPVRVGLNKYEDYYEEEVVEYDYEFTWFFPEGWKVRGAELAVPYEIIEDRVLVARVRKGTKVGPYEAILFEVLR